jgi:hypothetical protein
MRSSLFWDVTQRCVRSQKSEDHNWNSYTDLPKRKKREVMEMNGCEKTRRNYCDG